MMTTANNAIIQCQQVMPSELTFNHPCEGLTLDVYPGELISLIGPDYSGKSNWLKTLCGVEQQSNGEIKLLGQNIDTMSAKDWARTRTKIAYLPFDSALISAANVLQNVLLAARYHQLEKEPVLEQRARDLLKELDEELRLNELPAYLRKDQQYKVALARALILEPAVLILDAPFTLFDIESTKKTQQYLLEKVRQGLSLIQISHDIPYVLESSTKFVFLNKEILHIFHSKRDVLNCDIPAVREYLTHHEVYDSHG